MVEQTIFYILGSVFMAMAIIFLCLIAFYWIKILRNFQKISSRLEEISSIFKEKIDGLSGSLAIFITLMEKIINIYSRKKTNKRSDNKEKQKSNSAKQGETLAEEDI